MKNVTLAFISLFLQLSFLFSQVKTEELTTLKLQLEEAKKEYWSFKANSLRERKEMEDTFDLLDQEVKSTYLKKNNLQEEFYLVKESQDKIKEEFLQKKAEIAAFYSRLDELVKIEKKKSRSLFPYLLESSVEKLGGMEQLIQEKKHRQVLKRLIDYRLYLLAEAEISTINNKTMLISDLNQSVSGQEIRLGFVHSSFTSPEGEAILLRQTDLSGLSYSWKFDLPNSVEESIRKSIQSALKNSYGERGEDILVPVDVNQVGVKLTSISGSESKGFFNWFVKLFKDGGVLMYPLVSVAIFALIIIIERLIFFSKNGRKLKKVSLEITENIFQGKKEKALKFCQANSNPMTRVISPLLEKQVKNKKMGEEILEAGLLAEIPRLEKSLATLSVLAAVAPLMGLLGTVVGMITLFDVITLYGTNNPKILAGGISIALVTTQTGLAIAIPIMLIHHGFTRIKANLINSIEKNSIMVLNKIFS